LQLRYLPLVGVHVLCVPHSRFGVLDIWTSLEQAINTVDTLQESATLKRSELKSKYNQNLWPIGFDIGSSS